MSETPRPLVSPAARESHATEPSFGAQSDVVILITLVRLIAIVATVASRVPSCSVVAP
jgi:hypothetical protein